MGANSELQIKALDKRMSMVEKAIDQYEKQFRQIDYGALVKRLDELDKLIATLAMKTEDRAILKLVTDKGMLDHAKASKLFEEISKKETEISKKEAEALLAEAQKQNKQQMKEALNITSNDLARRLTLIEAKLTSLGR